MTIFIKRYALAAMLAGFSAGLAQPSFAFMVDATDVVASPGELDLTATVDLLRLELQSEGMECELMLGKIDGAIELVDAALDKGVVDEKKFLGHRDELVAMRLSLPCLGNDLAQDIASDGEVILSESAIGESVLGGPTGDSRDSAMGSSMAGALSVGGVGATGGGGATAGGGGAGSGTGGMSPLLLGGLAAAIAVPLAVGDDDPGVVASPSN